jgi:signal transduction histidine kinase
VKLSFPVHVFSRFHSSLRTYLGLSYLGVILIGMGIAAPLAWLAVEGMYLNTQSANLLAQAQLVASTLRTEASPSATTIPYSQLSNTLPGIHTRVIDAQGAVVIDLSQSEDLSTPTGLLLPLLAQNAAGQVSPEELMSRSEISQARLGQPATAIRRVEAAGGKRVLYAAVPVVSSDRQVAQIVYLAMPLPDTQWAALPVTVRWQLVGVLLAAILVASAAGLLLARRISHPLGELAGAAHTVAAGDLGQSVPEDPSITELAVLSQAFNSMTASLRQADQAKTAFISDVSHELRTPLTVIKGTIETLQDGALDDLEMRGPFLASMSRETERLIRLVNDLLVLTRADASALNLQLCPIDLEELARLRCSYFENVASQRQVRLLVATSPQANDGGAGHVLADADRIARVLDNLLDNALRYAPPGSQVSVTITRKTDQVACSVADAGPGIPARHLPFIFERFYRADTARERETSAVYRNGEGGSGLGLAIVRSLVQAHGGGVAASSIEGQGTTITFWLPAVQS